MTPTPSPTPTASPSATVSTSPSPPPPREAGHDPSRTDRSPVSPRTLADLPTPALLVERSVLESNLDVMAQALPGERMRPHVKAHKCTSLSRLQRDAGHPGITRATVRECEGLAAAGLATDMLLANEVVDARRLGALVEAGHRITLAVDSDATVEAAAAGGVREVVIDVCVDLPRCGCAPEDAGRLADLARRQGPRGPRRDGLRGPSHAVAGPGGAPRSRRGVHGQAARGPRRSRAATSSPAPGRAPGP